jgi:16S rRNA (adenine1518-N6/adenine1519-N6)-dimethyltransferase
VSKTSIASSFPSDPVPRRPTEIAETLRRLGVRPSRGRGQSFLTDEFLADAEAALLDRTKGGRIVEIGGGLGLLTEALLRRGDRPTVIERDERLATHLHRTFEERIDLCRGDALAFDWRDDDRMIGNLPFVIGTPLILRALRARIPQMVVLVQEEVARRIAAPPGGPDYGRLTIFVRLFGTPELHQVVPSCSFYPEPEVNGQIVRIDARSGELPVRSVERLEVLVRILFSQRRKQLGNLLSRIVPAGGDVRNLIEAAGWPDDWARRRPQELPPEAYFRLAEALDGSPGGGI